MMRHKLDQYYTPKCIARDLVEQAKFVNPITCIDPTCGSGNLLLAANFFHKETKLIGLDRDRVLISKLKKERPDWHLSVADLNNTNSYSKTSVFSQFGTCDALLLNPPFSQVKNKHIDITYSGEKFRGSIAMSYLMRSLDLFTPKQGALVIAPESLLHSQLDEFARILLEKDYRLQTICDLENKTFKGARVHSTVFKLVPRTDAFISKPLVAITEKRINLVIERGGVQVHKVKNEQSVSGVPFIHTTSLKYLHEKKFDSTLKTSLSGLGCIEGQVLLMPRVGLPKIELMNIYNFRSEVQLSDCLFALRAESNIHLEMALDRIKRNWEEFSGLYRGTGARYVTLSKLVSWFALKRIHLEVYK